MAPSWAPSTLPTWPGGMCPGNSAFASIGVQVQARAGARGQSIAGVRVGVWLRTIAGVKSPFTAGGAVSQWLGSEWGLAL